MSRWLALADTSENFLPSCDSSTKGDKTQPEGENVGSVTFCQLSHGETDKNQRSPDCDAFEERAAIAENDGGLSRTDAEQLAAKCHGFENVVAFRAAQRKSETQHD